MTQFIDTYLKARNSEALESLRGFVTHIMTVTQGRAASAALEAAGDPAYYYTCVRSVFPIPSFGEVEACDVEEGVSVVGVWG